MAKNVSYVYSVPDIRRADWVDLSRYALFGWEHWLLELYPVYPLLAGELGIKIHVYFRSGREVEAVSGSCGHLRM